MSADNSEFLSSNYLSCGRMPFLWKRWTGVHNFLLFLLFYCAHTPVSDSETMSGEAAVAGDAGAVHEVKQFWKGPLESLHSLVSHAVYFWWWGGGVKFVDHLCFHPRVLKTGLLTSGAQIVSSC